MRELEIEQHWIERAIGGVALTCLGIGSFGFVMAPTNGGPVGFGIGAILAAPLAMVFATISAALDSSVRLTSAFQVVGALSLGLLTSPAAGTHYWGTFCGQLFAGCASMWLDWRVRTRRYPDGHCGRCGYNLHGLIDRRCPECGTTF